MMEKNRELTPKQLQYIFDFCKKWDVVYLDLRMELVDHIAEQISDIWKREPDLSFQEAFHRVYASFGIFGLVNIVETHHSIVRRKYWSEIKSGFSSWVKPPKIFGTLISTALLFSFLFWFPALIPIAFLITYTSLIGAGIFLLIKSRQLSKKINGEKTILLSSPEQLMWVCYLVYIIPAQSVYSTIFQNGIFPDYYNISTTGITITAVFIVVTALFLLINTKLLNTAKHQISDMQKQLLLYSGK